jgi:hypothetical protein
MGQKIFGCQPLKDIIFSHYKTYLEKRIRTFNASTEPTQSIYFFLSVELKLKVLKIYKALFS